MSIADLGYLSHVPVLAAAVQQSEGPILEIGCGYGSTPMLHTMCRSMGRKLVSIETDTKWFERFSPIMKGFHKGTTISGNFRIEGEFINAWHNLLPAFRLQRWGCVFLDFSPGEGRVEAATIFRHSSQYVIAHDAECDGIHGGGGNYQYSKLHKYFTNVEYYRLLRPHTLVLSNYKPLGLSEAEMGFEDGE